MSKSYPSNVTTLDNIAYEIGHQVQRNNINVHLSWKT